MHTSANGLPPNRSRPMPRIYRVAILGCGAIGGRNDSLRGWSPGQPPLSHAGAYRSYPRTELVAAADSDHVRLDEFGRAWGVRSLYGDYRELLEKEAIDVLSICTPAALHATVVAEAAARGIKAVFCEKPLAFDLAEAERAWTTAIGHGVLMLVNYTRRWNRSLQDLATELRNGTWGEIRRVSVLYPGGIVSNGAHALDLIRWLVEEVTTVRALGQAHENVLDPPLDALCHTQSGIPCVVQTCEPRNFSLLEVDILTTRGRLRVVANGRRIERFQAVPDSHYPAYRLLTSDGDAHSTDWEGCLSRAVEDLVLCLETGGRPKCGGEEAVEALRLATAIRLSAQEHGREVDVASLRGGLRSPAERPGRS